MYTLSYVTIKYVDGSVFVCMNFVDIRTILLDTLSANEWIFSTLSSMVNVRVESGRGRARENVIGTIDHCQQFSIDSHRERVTAFRQRQTDRKTIPIITAWCQGGHPVTKNSFQHSQGLSLNTKGMVIYLTMLLRSPYPWLILEENGHLTLNIKNLCNIDWYDMLYETGWITVSKSARLSYILLDKVPGKLKLPQIIRRSASSIPRVARSEPSSSRNTDLLDEGER